jgi:hypothetical protein
MYGDNGSIVIKPAITPRLTLVAGAASKFGFEFVSDEDGPDKGKVIYQSYKRGEEDLMLWTLKITTLRLTQVRRLYKLSLQATVDGLGFIRSCHRVTKCVSLVKLSPECAIYPTSIC